MKQRQLSSNRKALHYLGLGLIVIGFLTFGSVFVSGALHFGDFSNFEEQSRSMMMRGIVGMGLIIAGGVIAAVGRAGAAGSGIVPDPEQARSDLEPWSRMTGGVVKDALDEAGILTGENKPDALSFDEQLRRLHKLHQDGILSAAEYENKKKQILERA